MATERVTGRTFLALGLTPAGSLTWMTGTNWPQSACPQWSHRAYGVSVFTERLQHACCQPRVAWLAARYARGEEHG